MRVVISQSMYFPWVGLLEQVKLADIFIHYNDVQITKGFYNRVQIKTALGSKWLTVPLIKHPRDAHIDEVYASETNWRQEHRNAFATAYRDAPYLSDALRLMDEGHSCGNRLSDISRTSIIALSKYYDISPSLGFMDSAELNVPGKSSQRLLDIVKHVGGTRYITGHGARNYLDESIFTEACVAVEYMSYQRQQYPQLHGVFTPYVTGLDLVANCGPAGRDAIVSESHAWSEDFAIN